jgi:hypothetical protein
MRKYLLTFFVFVFIFSLFILNINNSADAQSSLPNCSSISGYRLIMRGSCTVLVNTNAVFNFKARDPDGGNLSWSINWGDGQSAPKFCPAFYPNTTFSPGHTWTVPGTYNVKLGVSNCKVDGDSTASFNVVVKNQNNIVVTPPIIFPTPTPTPTPNTYDFDMIVEKIGTWPTTTPQGQSVSFNAKLRNLGTQEDPKFGWLYSGYTKDPTKSGHGPVCLYRTDSTGTHVMGCPAGSSIFPIQSQPVCGNNHYVLKVDAFDDVLETNENNNEVSGDVFVDCSKKPDFVIEKVGTWPTTVKSGTKPLMYFVEKNIGPVAVGRAGTVRMMANNDYRGSAWEFQSLSPGSSTSSMQFGYWYSGSQNPTTDYWTPICQPGEKFTLKVCADNACGWGSSEIDEADENNNILTHEVTCQ